MHLAGAGTKGQPRQTKITGMDNLAAEPAQKHLAPVARVTIDGFPREGSLGGSSHISIQAIDCIVERLDLPHGSMICSLLFIPYSRPHEHVSLSLIELTGSHFTHLCQGEVQHHHIANITFAPAKRARMRLQ